MSTFMIGTQRSGSNLLRLMLNQLPDIAAPHPPHILQRMMPLVSKYGDLNKKENFATLVDDVCQLVELNPVPWENVKFGRTDVARRCKRHTLMSIFEVVYDDFARAKGAKEWCCKSLANVNYLPEIEQHFKNPKYIYLYRDGRDVALSFRKAIVGEKHFYHIAQDWAKSQRLALELGEKIGKDRFFSVSYEDITSATEQTMRRLCKFLGVKYEPSMLDFHQSQEAKRAASSSELWGNVTNPVQSNNSRKFLKEASKEDIEIFEAVAGDVLDALGYERVHVKKGKEIKFTDDQVKQFEMENQRFKDEVRNKTDVEDIQRRERQAALMQAIQGRFATSGRQRTVRS